MSLARLNGAEGEALLTSTCGASRWVATMLAARPFASAQAVHDAATHAFATLSASEIHEAMSHHPRIGDSSKASAAEAREQAGAAAAGGDVKAALAAGNRAYEARFGHIYLVCAAGKSGEELLAILNARLGNEKTTELAVAAAEQQKITHLRLDEILGGA